MSKNIILIYNRGALGDCIVSLSAIYEITRIFPNSPIWILGSPFYKTVLRPNFFIKVQKIIECDKKLKILNIIENHKKYWMSSERQTSISEVLQHTKVFIDLNCATMKGLLYAFYYRVPIRVCANKNILAKYFSTHFTKLNKFQVFHEKFKLLHVLSSLDKKYDMSINKHLFITPVFPSLENKKEIDTKLIIINPTASIPEKAWPSAHFKKLVQWLEEQNYNVKLIGTEKELHWLEEIATAKTEIIQEKNILKVQNIIAECGLFISNVSSLQFLAADTNCQILVLVGAANVKRWGPLGTNVHYIKSDIQLPKRKFFENKNEYGKKIEKLCYNSISVQEVCSNIEKIATITV